MAPRNAAKAPDKARALDKNAKGKEKEKEKEKKQKRAGSRTHSNKLYYIGGAIGTALIALLIGAAHTFKQARRRRRRAARERAAAGEPEPESEAPGWVVSESTMLIASVGLLALIVLVTLGIVFGQRWAAMWRARREAAAAKAAAAASIASRKAALAEARAALTAARSRAVARNAEEREKQRLFEERLLADIREHERKVAEAAEAEAAVERAEAEQARLEAKRIDERTRSAAAAALPPSGGTGFDGEGEWDVGDYDEAEAEWYTEEGGGTDDAVASAGSPLAAPGAGAAAAADDDDDDGVPPPADRLVLGDAAAAGGTRVSLEGMVISRAATARVADVWLALSCAKCSKVSEMGLNGLFAAEATRKGWCEQCGTLLSATLRPSLLTDLPSVIAGHVDVGGCQLVDVPRLSVLMACGRCDSELVLPPLQRGRTAQAGCRGCHAPLSLKINNVVIERLGGSSAGGRRATDDDDELEALLKKLRKKNLDQFKHMGLVIGKPLPQKGACKHYGCVTRHRLQHAREPLAPHLCRLARPCVLQAATPPGSPASSNGCGVGQAGAPVRSPCARTACSLPAVDSPPPIPLPLGCLFRFRSPQALVPLASLPLLRTRAPVRGVP